MKNNECKLYIITRRGSKQLYKRGKDCWTQTCPNGKVRKMTGEQLLSHILPVLAAGNAGRARVVVKKDKKLSKRN